MRKFEDGAYVNEEKFLFWLKHISKIGNRFIGSPLSLELIKMHTKALINLWEHQKLIKPDKTNPNHPRGYGVKLFEGILTKYIMKSRKLNLLIHLKTVSKMAISTNCMLFYPCTISTREVVVRPYIVIKWHWFATIQCHCEVRTWEELACRTAQQLNWKIKTLQRIALLWFSSSLVVR